jgi:hypothetical protein
VSGRGPLLAVVVLVLGLGVAVAVAASGDDGPSRPAGLQGDFADGVLERIAPTELALRLPADGRVVSFAIPPERVAALDLPHLRQHRAQGLPTRVIFEERDGRLWVVAALDAPFWR